MTRPRAHHDPLASLLGLPTPRRTALRLAGGSLATLALSLGAPSARAQDPTPAPGPEAIAVEDLGTGPPMAAPGQKLALIRLTLAPGAALPPHGHPGAVVARVEAGTFGFTVLEGEHAHITRRAGAGAPPPTETPPVGRKSWSRLGRRSSTTVT